MTRHSRSFGSSACGRAHYHQLAVASQLSLLLFSPAKPDSNNQPRIDAGTCKDINWAETASTACFVHQKLPVSYIGHDATIHHSPAGAFNAIQFVAHRKQQPCYRNKSVITHHSLSLTKAADEVAEQAQQLNSLLQAKCGSIQVI